MILINVKFPVRPDKVDEWLALADDYAAAVNREEGNVFFQFSRSLDDPNEFVCIEGFRNDDAAGAHVKTEHFAMFIERAPDLVEAQPQIININAPQATGWGPMGEIVPRT